jgi:DNA-binding response OmpR family regulator
MQEGESLHKNARYQALLIEADDGYRAAISACLRLAGCQVQQVRDPEHALAPLERQRFDLLVWGVAGMVGGGRGEMISELRLRSEAPLVMLEEGAESAQFDLEAGADRRRSRSCPARWWVR